MNRRARLAAGAAMTGAVAAATVATGLVVLPRVERAAGEAVYQAHCATCHGLNLKGATIWQERLPNGRWPPPPHDATGHTWHHDDDLLFNVVKHGPQAILGADYQTDMPAFGQALSDRQIVAVLSYIKSTWPEEQAAYQRLMNRPASERLIQP